MMSGAIDERAQFDEIRYALGWEDADVLVEALRPAPGQRILSIAASGDNTLALLAGSPDEVVALDLSPAQLALLELRVAVYRALDHNELLAFLGTVSASGEERIRWYRACRPGLEKRTRDFWDERTDLIEQGFGHVGKFERYFEKFRRCVLPLIHGQDRVAELLSPRSDRKDREQFFERHWNTFRWRMLFRVFFSRFVMGRLGRDPSFFDYVEGSVADRIHDRVRHALVELEPNKNPYLRWILEGSYQPDEALPLALREENFQRIHENLDRLSWQPASLEAHLDSGSAGQYDAFNLSDIFEYVSEDHAERLLSRLVDAARPGARLAYWNLLASRSRPESMADLLRPLEREAQALHHGDKAFFYSRFVLEEVTT